MTPTLAERLGGGRFEVLEGDCLDLVANLPDESVDVVVTSPPYWGQRQSLGNGAEEDPRDYIAFLETVFLSILPKLKPQGIVWLNLGDSYNTPVNWGYKDYKYSSLGPSLDGLKPSNSAYTKPRLKRKAYIEKASGWLQYDNLLMLPRRLLIALTEEGYLYRGEVIWAKRNAMPEGRCRRPHRKHESVFLLARNEDHSFRVAPPVPSVWDISNEKVDGLAHYSRFPVELPRRCIEAYGSFGSDVFVLDPFSGSGTTGLAALQLGCSYIGFEIDPKQVEESKRRLLAASFQGSLHTKERDAPRKRLSRNARNGRLDL